MRNYYPLVKGGRELGAAFSGAGNTEQNANDKALGQQFLNAMRQAQGNKYQSEADLNQNQLDNRMSARDNFVRSTAGITQPQLSELSNAMMNGWQQVQTDGPPTAQGEYPTMESQPDFATPEVMDRFNLANQTLSMNDLATGKSQPNQIAQAFQAAMNVNRQDKMIQGDLDPSLVAQAMAATAGKPMVDVTSSGIGFDRFGDKNDLNSQPFIQKANIDANAKIKTVLNRAGVRGSQLPSEAKMIQFYISLGYEKDKAVELARSKKNQPIRDLAADLYLQVKDNMMLSPDTQDMSEQEIETMTQEKVIDAMRFLSTNQDRFTGNEQAPMPGAKKAPDGLWYIEQDGQWYRVDK